MVVCILEEGLCKAIYSRMKWMEAIENESDNEIH